MKLLEERIREDGVVKRRQCIKGRFFKSSDGH